MKILEQGLCPVLLMPLFLYTITKQKAKITEWKKRKLQNKKSENHRIKVDNIVNNDIIKVTKCEEGIKC